MGGPFGAMVRDDGELEAPLGGYDELFPAGPPEPELGEVDSALATWRDYQLRTNTGSDAYGRELDLSLEILQREFPEEESLRGARTSPFALTGRESEPPTFASAAQKEETITRAQPLIEQLKTRGVSVRTVAESRDFIRQQMIESERQAGRASWIGGTIGYAAAAATDPINIAAMVLTPTPTGVAARVAMAFASNVVSESLVQVVSARTKQEQVGLDWQPQNALWEIGAAGVGGVAIGEGLRGLGKLAGKAAARRPMRVGVAESEAARALAERGVGRQAVERGIPARNAEFLVRNQSLDPNVYASRTNPMPDVPGAAMLHIEALEQALDAANAGRLGPGLLDLMEERIGRAEAELVEAKESLAGAKVRAVAGRQMRRVREDVTEARARVKKMRARLNSAREEGSRRVGDEIGQVGGKPFKLRREATAYARERGLAHFEVVKRGRGYRVALKPTPEQAARAAQYDFEATSPNFVEVEPVAIPALDPEEAATSAAARMEMIGGERALSTAVALREASVATDAPDMTVSDALAYWRAVNDGTGKTAFDPVAAPEAAQEAAPAMPAVAGEAPPAAVPDLETVRVEEMDKLVDVELEGGGVLRSADGSPQKQRLGDLVGKLDRERSVLDFLRGCIR